MKKYKVSLVINGQWTDTIIIAADSSQAMRLARAQYGNQVRTVIEVR